VTGRVMKFVFQNLAALIAVHLEHAALGLLLS
jgi:hypothetical protein